jgi:hypothetical protein
LQIDIMPKLKPVDCVEIHALVDNVANSPSSAPSPFPVTREWLVLRRRGMRIVTGGSMCCASHGLALVISTAYENEFADQVRRQSDDASWEQDALLIDERFLMLRVCGKGLVFSVCSHAGIINVLHHARASFPGLKLYAVIQTRETASSRCEKHLPR